MHRTITVATEKNRKEKEKKYASVNLNMNGINKVFSNGHWGAVGKKREA
jgi:hypothetical protein